MFCTIKWKIEIIFDIFQLLRFNFKSGWISRISSFQILLNSIWKIKIEKFSEFTLLMIFAESDHFQPEIKNLKILETQPN